LTYGTNLAVNADHARQLERELTAASKHYDSLRVDFDLLECDYQKVVREVLKCDPISACERADGKLEPPWEVIARIRQDNAARRAVQPSVHTCSDECQRPLCVLRRELAAALADNAALREEVRRVGKLFDEENAQALEMADRGIAQCDEIANLRAQLAAAQAKIAALETELEANAWTISPAMAQAKIDQLNAKIAELQQSSALNHDTLGAVTATLLDGRGCWSKSELVDGIRALQADKARLDWLAQENNRITLAFTIRAVQTYREGIDVARKEGQP
jgi:hypothetical protein